MAGQPASSRMNILIADDEEGCRDLLRDIFAPTPEVTLTMTCDGAQAWWALTEPQQRFDLGIFDLKMPVVDGLALIARIRTAAHLRHLPVILCTGTSDRETVAKAARLSINHYVVKPYRAVALREKALTYSPRYALGPDRTLLSS